LDNFGLGVAASRLTTGNHPLFGALEADLARFFGVAKALAVPAGYAADPIAAQGLKGEATHTLLDCRAHASLREAADLLGRPLAEFAHRDATDLRRQLRALPATARPLVFTDGVFGHDGSIAPLADYLAVLPARGRLLVDDAHGAGVVGHNGRGVAEVCDVADPRLIITGTLSKAFGASGGFVLGSATLIRNIVSRSRWFGASTPMSLPAAAAAMEAIEILRGDLAMRARLRQNTAWLKAAARAVGHSVPDNVSPILAVAPENQAQAGRLRRRLLQQGIYPSLVRYPGGPEAGYFRFAVSSEHSRRQLERLAAALRGG
jgi:7-keto-8-aminopelargonate synthetase-like enzyme